MTAWTTVRLTLKLHRLEIGALTVIALIITGGALLAAIHLDGLGIPRACFRPGEIGSADCSGLPSFYDAAGGETAALRPIAAVLPFLVGLFLGVPLVGRELEHGTSRLAWALALSRGRWFVSRFAVLGLVALVLVALPALAMDRLEASTNPGSDPSQSFSNAGVRGLTPLGWTLAALAIGALAGTWAGRQLPSLIIAGVLCAVGWTATNEAISSWLRTQAVALQNVADPASSRYLEMRFRDAATGELLAAAQLEARIPPERANDGNWLDANYQAVPYGLPGTQYREVDLVMSACALGLASAAATAAFLVTLRRHPGS